MKTAKQFSTREAADLLGAEEWQVRRVITRGLVPEPPRFAGKRIITGEMLPAIIDALRTCGWLPPTDPARDAADAAPLADAGDESIASVSRPRQDEERRGHRRPA